jgi:diaminopimelate decarboxylase
MKSDIWRDVPGYSEQVAVFRQWKRDHPEQDYEVVLFHNLDLLWERVNALKNEFPSNARHHLAIKANPSLGLLIEALNAGLGLEAASWGEVELALEAGAIGKQILFDSPAKTYKEIDKALALGVIISCDSMQELDRVFSRADNKHANVLLRINPEIGYGSISYTSVATHGARFGVPLSEIKKLNSSKLVAIANFISGLHYHLGSQGISLQMHREGFLKVKDFCHKLNKLKKDSTEMMINIGGGAPATLGYQAPIYTPSDLAQMVNKELKSSKNIISTIITEFGRAILADTGWCVSKIEYVHTGPNRSQIVTHVGADMFLRAAYCPQDWSHEIRLCQKNFSLSTNRNKRNASRDWDVFGPLCFSGDHIGVLTTASIPKEGDFLFLNSVGAYTLGLWSKHCSRLKPAVIGYRRNSISGYDFTLLTHKQSYSDLISEWK